MSSSSKPTIRRQVSVVLSILILASLACSLTDISGPATTPSPAPTRAPTQPPPVQGGKPLRDETLPPVLVETDPPAGSRIAPSQPVVFYFSQPMDHAAAEAALRGAPAPSGSFEWLDETTLRFTPDQPYPTDIPVSFTFSSAALSASGIAMQADISIDFTTAGPLKVAERLPKPGVGDANPTSAVIITFTDPVVPLGADPAGLPPAFTLQPVAEGKGEWINTSTYIFYPDPALKGGVIYTVLIDPNLTSTLGGALDLSALTPADWSFTTSGPQVLSVDWGESDFVPIDQPIEITFNQPMDAGTVAQNLRLLNSGGVAAEVEFSWDESGSLLTLKPSQLLERGERYFLQIGGFATGLGGTPLGTDLRYEFITVSPLRVLRTDPPNGQTFSAGYGIGSFSIEFSAPLAPNQDFAALIDIQPQAGDLNFNLGGNSSLYIIGAFQPSTTYTLRLSDQIKDRWGLAMGEMVELVFVSEQAQPSLVIPAAQSGGPILFIPAGETNLAARVTNLNLVTLETGALEIPRFIDLAEYRSVEQVLTPQKRWDLALDLPADSNQELRLPLSPDASPLAPGLYFFSASSPALNNGSIQQIPYLLVVSRIQLTLKKGGGEVVVWAVDLPTQKPAADLLITIYNNTGQEVSSCRTGVDGLCRASDIGVKDFSTLYASAGQPGDATFGFASTGMASGIGPWEYGIATGESLPRPLLYLYTDRPIYRPGQQVFFRAVLRQKDDARYTPLGVESIEVQVMPPYDYLASEVQPLTTLRLPISAYGTANGTFSLPPGSAPGYYTIKSPDFELAGGISFQVAEYKKPEFELGAAFTKTDVLPGEALQASVTAAYYFGAPAGNLRVNWILTRRSAALYIPGGWETGPYDTNWLNFYPFFEQFGTFVTQGQAITAPDGTLMVEIPADALAQVDPQQRQTLTLEVTAVDESGFPVSTRAETLFHPAAFYVGVRPEAWGIQAGAELGFSLQTVDWKVQPSGNHNLSASFSKVRWVRKDPPGGLGEPTYKKELTPVASTDLRTDGLGRARVAFTPPDAGVYELAVSGEGALTSLLTWVGGPGSPQWPNLPSQRLRLETDAASYVPGQTARLRFANPFPGEALALVTIERSRVLSTQVIQVSGSMAEVEIPIDPFYAPNVFAAVTLLGRKENGQPDFRQGFLEVNVDPAALKLNVTVQPSAERAQPGQDLGLTLKVTDSSGAPVQGEFSLALVDKAVLALADPNVANIMAAFYGPQPLGVVTGLNLASYSGRLLPMAVGRGGGGGGDLLTDQTRTNFKDTAIWVGAVETDADGLTRIDFQLPDNLTTWVADIRGLSVDTLVGEARVEIITSKDLLVRPVAPRFLTAGDHLFIAAIVQNNTAGPLSTTVELQAPGLTIDAATPATQTIDVPGGERRRVDWWVTVENVASVDPLFSVEGGGLSDATRLESGPLPVLRYTSPQTFATGGMLAEGGERLEVVSLPRTFTPVGGELKVELAPSLAASVLEGLKALEENFPADSTEQILSRLLPNLAAYRALTQLNLDAPSLGPTLTSAITEQLRRLLALQREDGGFGWNTGDSSSQPYLSAYALIALTEAKNQGFLNNQPVFDRLSAYLFANFFEPDQQTEAWRLDQLAFMAYAAAGYLQAPDPSVDYAIAALYDRQELLSPWAKALLAQTINLSRPGDERIQELVSILESGAVRSATGASWDAPGPGWYNWSTPGFSTAIVVYTLAKLDPAAPVLTDAVRYLVLSRRPNGCWQSSYESAWVLFALSEALTATGDLQADFTYEAELNGTSIASGSPAAPASALQPVQATVPLTDLFPDGSNALRIRRSEGSGRLYYRAFLAVNRPAEDAPPLERGISLSRAYYRSDQQCRLEDCVPVSQAALADASVLLVRLTVTVPHDMYFVVVKDTIPAGVEIINPNLNTSQRVFAPEAGPDTPAYDLRDPFGAGYGAWFFGQGQIRDQGVSWTAPYLPAGTYQLTYRVVPVIAGEFRILPAQAYQYYFTDIQGTSSGAIFTIE